MLHKNPQKSAKKPLHKLGQRLANISINYLNNIISGKSRGVLSAIIRAGLLIISWIGLLVVKSRRWLYLKGIFSSKRLLCKVISVGNVTVGGSGKTPAVIALATMLRDYTNLKIGILSRGYLSKIKGPAVVSDGKNLLLNSIEAGDEPYLMGKNLPNIPVFIGKNKIKTGLIASRKWGCQLLILDDGFQYLKLARNLDIITIDATRPFGYDRILPRGYLREPLSTLKHAGLILLTRVDQCENMDYVRNRLSKVAPSVPIFESIHKPVSFYHLHSRQEFDLNAIKDKKILAVCGIANPESFLKILQTLNPYKLEIISFPDHFSYPPDSIEKIKNSAERLNADIIVTTEKDSLKLNSISSYPVMVLKVRLEFINISPENLLEAIVSLISN